MATVSSASSTSLSVTVPVSTTYAPITVTVNGYTAYSNKPFMVIFPTAQSISASSFATNVSFAAGNNPYSVAIGDLDGDGKPDIVVANANSNTISVYRNTSISGSITSSSLQQKLILQLEVIHTV